MGAAVVRFVAFSPRIGVIVPIEGNRRPAILSPDGSQQTKVGTVGQGPGEFLFINSLGTHPDGTAWAFDARQARITRFAADGEYLDSQRCMGSICVLLSDGTRIALAQRPLGSLNPAAHTAGFTFTIARSDGDSETPLRSVIVPSGQLQIPQEDGGVFVTMNPWGGQPQVSIGPASTSIAVLVPTRRHRAGQVITEIWSIEAGDSLRITEFLSPTRKLTKSEVRGWVDDFVDTPRRARFTARAVESVLDVPEYAPGATDIVAVGGGKWWLMVGHSGELQRWVLVGPTGKVEGEARFPADAQLLLMEGDRALALEKGEFDVPVLSWFRVSPPTGSSDHAGQGNPGLE
jgi:hypothetical protein